MFVRRSAGFVMGVLRVGRHTCVIRRIHLTTRGLETEQGDPMAALL